MDDRLIPLEGGLYVATSEKPFQILKVLRLEDEIVHIRPYKSWLDEIPARVDPATLTLAPSTTLMASAWAISR